MRSRRPAGEACLRHAALACMVVGSRAFSAAAQAPALDAVAVANQSAAPAGDEELFLEVVLNQSQTGRIARFVRRGRRFFAAPSTLRQLGVRWSGQTQGDGLIDLDEIAGASVVYDQPLQRLALTVPVQALDRPVERVGLSASDEASMIDPSVQASGLLFNYDLYGQRQSNTTSLSGTSGLRAFGLGPGAWSSTMVSHTAHTSSGTQTGNVRLDTNWQLDWPEHMLSLVVGDSTTTALNWTRATHFGGVHLGTNFGLQPYRITSPLASFVGQATVPSTVDLYIDGLKLASQPVQPGVFQMDSVPTLNGAGQAQLVITGINGQSRVIGFGLYGAPNLLAPGLTEWSLDLGNIRRNYGVRSFSYAPDPMFSATFRHGLNNALTVEGHAEATSGLGLAGLGAAWLIGQRGGVASTAVSTSQGRSQNQGTGYLLSYQWSSPAFNVYASTTRNSRFYRDVASLEGGAMPLRTDQAYLGTNFVAGQLGASYVRQDVPGTASSRYASLSWTSQLPHGATLNFSLNRNLRAHDQDSAYVYWSIPLDRHDTLGASASLQRGRHQATLEASRSAPIDQGGWGWRAQITSGNGSYGMAQATYLNNVGQWTAGVNRWSASAGGQTLTYATGTGSVLWTGGHSYALRNVDDAFAMVSTSGVAGVPVRLENRLVGTTDTSGMLLVTPLRGWQRNRLSIDPLNLPANLRIGTTEVEAVPAGHVGVKAVFDLRQVRSVQFNVRDINGAPLPAGTAVHLADGTAITVVGHDGMVFLQDLPAGQARLDFRADTQRCSLQLPAAPLQGGTGPADLGTLECR